MKKILLIALIGLHLLLVGGIVLDDGLILADGQERLIMNVGEKTYLKINNSIWGYPIWQGLEYSSRYPHIAYVDRNGCVHALMSGRTVISVWNDRGDNGTIEIVVRGRGKTVLGIILWVLCCFFACLAVAGDKNVLPFLTKIKNKFCAK